MSLVETLIASAILTTAMASLGALFAGAAHAPLAGRAAIVSYAAALDGIESLRASRQASGEGAEWLGRNGAMLEDADTGPAYQRRWRVEPVDAGVSALVRIEVCVTPLAPDALRAHGHDTCVGAVHSRWP